MATSGIPTRRAGQREGANILPGSRIGRRIVSHGKQFDDREKLMLTSFGRTKKCTPKKKNVRFCTPKRTIWQH